MTRKGAESRRRVANASSGDPAQHPTAHELKDLLGHAKLFVCNDWPTANDQIGPLRDNGFDNLGDVGAAVLVVAIRVYHDIRALAQSVANARCESGREAAIAPKSHDVVNPKFRGDFDRSIGASIIDHLKFDDIYSWDGPRKIGDRAGKSLFFVKAGNLYDQLQMLGGVRIAIDPHGFREAPLTRQCAQWRRD